MKCAVLINVWIQTSAAIVTKPSSACPLTSSGTRTINDSPPTQRKSTTGLRMEGDEGEGEGARAALVASAPAVAVIL
jgi:hypothetical protein